ncbi:MAG: dihydropteroate synthase, partial [Deltaproteobacteria bacterium]|nr:dihydropteroate synthase [Deltaproteobacteria bacterium]
AATIAAKEVGLPVVATMTFDETMRTVLGTSPEAFAVTGSALGLSALGANCSLGVEGIYKALEVMSRYTTVPLMAQPNAGLPVLKDGETIFPATPEEMANYVPRFVSVGVRILGGCCGTTPEHIQKMGADFKALKTEKQPKKNFNVISSRSAVSAFGGDNAALIIGERINPTGRKKFAAEIKEEKIKTIRTEAREQTEAGATALDVNVGVPDIDEVAAMKRAVFCVSENSILPIVVDSSDIAALEEGLKSVDGKPLINSVSGEEAKLDSVLPLAKRYGAALIGLALDDDGIPKTAEGRLKVAEKILKRAEKIGIPKEDLIIDCLAMTISAEPDSANETLRAIKLIREELGLSTALGVSNISFGLPSRATVNSNFFSMALSCGLDAAIVNPKNEMMMDAYHASMVLLNKDDRAEGYIERFRDKSGNAAAPTKTKKEEPKDIRSRLARAIVEGDEGHIVDLVDEALTEGLSPLEVSNEGLIIGLNEVGVLFGSNRYFL